MGAAVKPASRRGAHSGSHKERRGEPAPRGALRRAEARAGWLFISPWLVGFLIFTAVPMIASLYLSFTEYDVLRPPHAVGLSNYQQLLVDPRIRISLWNSFFYAVLFVPLATITALALALLLDKVSRAAGLFRTIFYLPSLTPTVAVGALWLWILNPDIGLLNRGLALLGIHGPAWTTDPTWIKPGLVLMSLWSLGGTVVIYYAALRGVPHNLYEAVRIEGANAWQEFRHVTLPLISGAIFFTLVVNTIAALQIFDQVYTMYFGQMESGAASNAALFYVIYLFRQAFEFLHMGYASAMAWLLFVLIMILTVIQLRLSRRWVYYEGR